jgi:hypothetical protein
MLRATSIGIRKENYLTLRVTRDLLTMESRPKQYHRAVDFDPYPAQIACVVVLQMCI